MSAVALLPDAILAAIIKKLRKQLAPSVQPEHFLKMVFAKDRFDFHSSHNKEFSSLISYITDGYKWYRRIMGWFMP